MKIPKGDGENRKSTTLSLLSCRAQHGLSSTASLIWLPCATTCAARQEHAAITLEDVTDSSPRKKGITGRHRTTTCRYTVQPRRLAVVARPSKEQARLTCVFSY